MKLTAPPPHRALPPRSLSWLLWLALVWPAALPLAQSAALWHGLSHITTPADGGTGKSHEPRAAHDLQCELCLVAAAVSAGAAPVQGQVLPSTEARHPAPQASGQHLWLAALSPAYQSRAPPISL